MTHTYIQRAFGYRPLLLLVLSLLLAACGGGGGGGDTTISYTVTASAGAGGSISPASATVNEGATTSFTVTPDSGFAIAGVTGCSGTLVGSTYTTDPVTADCSVTASFVSLPPPTVSVANNSVTEGNSGTADLIFTVNLSAAASGDVTVNYATSDGTATAGTDYTATNGTLTIPAGNTSGTVTVSVIGDTAVESNETLTLTLSNPAGATLGAATATGTINDDDSGVPLPTASIADANVTEGDSGTTNLTFTVSLSAAASGDVMVTYATSDGTATTADNDYTASNGTLTISAGNTSGTVTVSVTGDTAVESNETLTVTLSNPVGAALGTATATGTITNDDTAQLPTVSIANASVTEGDSGSTNLTFTVSLSTSASGDVTVNYATSDGTATAGSDYSATNDTLTISAGNTSGTVAVSVTGDTAIESNETLTMTLSNPVGATLGTATATGTIIDDDSPPSGAVSGLFYNSGSISMLDPATPSVTPVLVDAAVTVGEAGIWDGVIDIAGQRATGIHIRTIIYANTDAGMLYKISALKSDPQTPTRVSNETGAAMLCDDSSEWASDWDNHSNSVYLYGLPGADDLCGTFDDEWKMVRVGMDSTVSPIAAKQLELALLNSSTGAIIGFLALDDINNKIVRCDQDFQNCSDVISYFTNGGVLEDNPFIGAAILRVDDKLYHYNVATGNLSAALHTLPSSFSFVLSDADGTNVYFTEFGTELYKLPMDGSANSSLLVTAGDPIFQIDLTTNRVVYATVDTLSDVEALEAVDKSGGTSTTLSTAAGPLFPQTAGNLVYYTRLLPSGALLFGVIKDDGTGGTETQNAYMSGYIFSRTQGYAESSYSKIVWIEGCSPTGSTCTGGTLKSVDAATNTGAIDLGTIPAGVDIIFLVGFDDGVLGINTSVGYLGFGGDLYDIFFANLNQAGSLQQITATPSIGEFPIY